MKINKFLIVAVILLGLIACDKPYDKRTISNETFVLSSKPTIIDCSPPLARTRNSGILLLDLVDEWTPEPPWQTIRIEDGSEVRLEIILIGENSDEYKPSILGMAGGLLMAKFEPEIAKTEKIKSIKLISNRALKIKQVIWENYNPK